MYDQNPLSQKIKQIELKCNTFQTFKLYVIILYLNRNYYVCKYNILFDINIDSIVIDLA